MTCQNCQLTQEQLEKLRGENIFLRQQLQRIETAWYHIRAQVPDFMAIELDNIIQRNG